ncbi:hypothetical protein TKK_0003644 [Trichogramma kaykai]
MNRKRDRLSGAQYRKIREEKSAKEKELIKSTYTLHSFFSCSTSKKDEVLVHPVSDENSSTLEIEESNDTATSPKDCSENEIIGHGDITISDDPANWVVDDNFIKVIVKTGFSQNMDIDFSTTKRFIGDRNRYLTKNSFFTKLANGKECLRTWLIYSKKFNAVFCGPCKLFGEEQACTTGYDDWSNISKRLREHESSIPHKTNSISYLEKQNKNATIQAQLDSKLQSELEYWRAILRRIVAVIKSLSSRGLAFRGSNENFGSVHNGNYLMALELIAEFDPLLSEHIEKTTDQKIVNEIKEAKYFSISVDSTPDISHVDQLTFIVRYVDSNGQPQERFLKFIANCGHKAEETATAVLATLEELGLNLNDCRGQSYDNAANMSGCYSGLQARIRELNPLADYVPCSAHSLNLVGNFETKTHLIIMRLEVKKRANYNVINGEKSILESVKPILTRITSQKIFSFLPQIIFE